MFSWSVGVLLSTKGPELHSCTSSACRTSPTRDQSMTPLLEAQSLNHWTTRDVSLPYFWIAKKSLSFVLFPTSPSLPQVQLTFREKEETLSLWTHSIKAILKFPFEILLTSFLQLRASLIAQMVKNPPAMQETLVQFLGPEDPLEKGKATHSSILAWRIPRTG